MSQASRRSRSVAVAIAVAAALIASLFAPGISGVAEALPPPAPTGLTPNGGPVGQNTELTWDLTPGAVNYDVQASVNPTFSPLLININNTPNTTYSPPDELPVGTLYWRVRAGNPDGESPWTDAQFDKALSGPDLISPTHGEQLEFPEEPPTFAWTTLPTAKSYVLEIDDADDFIGAQKIVTSAPTYTLTNTQVLNQTYYWRVRGASTGSGGGVLTDWSDTSEYSMYWPNPSPMLLEPPNTVPLTPVTDIELVWTPVLGADSYQLQVSRNVDFSGQMVEDRVVFGTRFSPPQTYDNGAYHWRVRPRDEGGHLGEWSETFSFTRNWTPTPTLVAPIPFENDLDPLRFSWSPVDHASEYEIQVGTDPNFSPGTFKTCNTVQTSVTPYKMFQGGTFGGCGIFSFDHGDTYHWRVRGIDDRTGVLGLWSEVRPFIRRMPIPTRTAPMNGAVVTTPVLTWNEVEGAREYRVRVVDKDGSQVENRVTWSRSYVPTNKLTADKSPYRWYVTTISDDGNGVIPAQGSWSTFSVPESPVTGPAPTILTPADGAQAKQMPAMTWTPVEGATKYEIWYSVVGSGTKSRLTEAPRNAGFSDWNQPLPEGSYEWWVEAHDGNTLLGSSPPRVLHVVGLDEVTMVAPAHCPPSDLNCDQLLSSPTFEWEYLPQADFYLVTLAFDTNFTNIIKTYRVEQNFFIPREEYPDNDAGQAYYWHVRPCKSTNRCAPDPQGVHPPQRAFQKRSDPVALIAPTSTEPQVINNTLTPVQDQPRFEWGDYLATNGSDIEAERYRIQVSTVPTFASTLENRIVDQTFFTPFDRTYPEGPLYWRVRAIDASGNELTWSNEQPDNDHLGAVNKSSPPPTMEAPTSGQNINGQPTFSWAPQAFAEGYRIEVAANGDTNFSPANRVVNKATAHTQYTPEDPLPPGQYAWRIRRDDGQGKDGPWTAGSLFTVTQAAPTLLNPGPGALIQDDQIVFTWSPLPRAVAYRFERSATANFASITESRTTVMTSWAPTVAYPHQVWYWRVHALDGKGNVLGTSTVRDFRRGEDPRPSPPQNLTRTNSPGRITVSWLPPLDQGDPLFTQYVVTLNPGNVVRQLNRNTTSTTFNGLTNGNAYNISVVARNSQGDSPEATITGQPNGCTQTPFSDVGATHLFCGEIRWMYQTGLSAGSIAPDGTVRYLPSQAVARDAMAAFLYRYAGSPSIPNTAPHFADVPSSHLFFDEIQWMFKSGNSTGFPNPNGGKPLYKPAAAVDRQSMAAFLYRAAGNPTVIGSSPHFADVAVGHTFFGPIQWMFQSGLSFGVPNPVPGGKPFYQPTVTLSRAAMAAFMMRYDQL